MILPHIVPNFADIVELARIGLVAALTVGMGSLVGARRLETAFFSGWGLACLLFVGAGTWLHLDLALLAWIAAAIGLLGLLRSLLSFGGNDRAADRLGLPVLLLGLPWIVLVLGMSDIAWDDFAFWVPNLMHLCATHHFPTLAQPAVGSAYPAYPYGLALAGFAVALLGGGHAVDTVALIWNLLALLRHARHWPMFCCGACGWRGSLCHEMRCGAWRPLPSWQAEWPTPPSSPRSS